MCPFAVLFFQVLVEMTKGGVDRAIECTGNVNAMISAFECVHDVISLTTPAPNGKSRALFILADCTP